MRRRDCLAGGVFFFAGWCKGVVLFSDYAAVVVENLNWNRTIYCEKIWKNTLDGFELPTLCFRYILFQRGEVDSYFYLDDLSNSLVDFVKLI